MEKTINWINFLKRYDEHTRNGERAFKVICINYNLKTQMCMKLLAPIVIYSRTHAWLCFIT